jgi:hypothetical protein
MTTSATQTATNLVGSLVAAGLASPTEASILRNSLAPSDTVQPTTSVLLSPTPNSNGWNRTNVTINLTAIDNPGGSGVKQISIVLSGAQAGTSVAIGASGSITIAAEGLTTLSYFATDNAGNSETAKTLAIRIDKTAPTVAAVAIPAPNATGLNNTNVTVTFSGTDGLSGVDFCTPALTVSAEGIGQIVSGTCTDKAGNVSPPVSKVVNIDKTAPIFNGIPAPGTCTLWPPNHKLVQVATISVTDVLSGVAAFDVTGTSNEPPDPGDPDIVITGSGLQPRVVQLIAERLGAGTGRIYTLTATATDRAGNPAVSSFTCTVAHDQDH